MQLADSLSREPQLGCNFPVRARMATVQTEALNHNGSAPPWQGQERMANFLPKLPAGIDRLSHVEIRGCPWPFWRMASYHIRFARTVRAG